MGQAKQRGSFKERKELALYYQSEKQRYQNWLESHTPRLTRQERQARNQLKAFMAVCAGHGFFY